MMSIEFWISNTLLQKLLTTNMRFFDQFIVYTVKLAKKIAESVIPITMFHELVG